MPLFWNYMKQSGSVCRETWGNLKSCRRLKRRGSCLTDEDQSFCSEFLFMEWSDPYRAQIIHQWAELHIVYVSLPPLLLSYFMTSWKQTASTSDLKLRASAVTQSLSLGHSGLSHFHYAPTSGWASRARPARLQFPVPSTLLHYLLKKKTQKMLFAWKTYRSKMAHVHDDIGALLSLWQGENWQYCYIPCKCGSGEHHLPALTRCYLLCFPSVQRSKRAHHTDTPE